MKIKYHIIRRLSMRRQRDGDFFARLVARRMIDVETKERIREKRAEIARLKNEIHREYHARQRQNEEDYFRGLMELEREMPFCGIDHSCAPDPTIIRNYRRVWYRRKIGGVVVFLLLFLPIFFVGGFSLTIKVLFFLIAILVILTQIADFALYVRFDRRILTPIAELEQASRAIAKGLYTVRVEPRQLSEINSLIESFNMMAASLAESEALKAEYEKNRKELVASISHDLKTPISAILGYVEAADQIRFAEPELIEKYAKVVAANASYMNRLIDDLFLFSKLDMHKLDFHFEETALKPFMSDLMQEFAIELDWRGADFAYDDGIPESVLARLDVKRFIQVLKNITENAVKYGHEGKLKLSVASRVTNGTFTLSIRDNGPGVSPEKLARVFERFYRVDCERTKDLGSTGLGLAIAKELIEAHGGTILASNIPEGGLEFAISVPLSGPEGAGPENAGAKNSRGDNA